MAGLPMKGLIYEVLTGNHNQMVNSDGRRSACADIELNMMECLEAYGSKKGLDLCYKYIEDFQECRNKNLAHARVHYMRMIRAKKIATGEIPWDKRVTDPVPYDSFINGTFFP